MDLIVNSTVLECAKSGATAFAMSSNLGKTVFYVTQTAFWNPMNLVNEFACSKLYFTQERVDQPKKGWIASVKDITGCKKIKNSKEMARILYSTTIATALYIPATLLTQNLLTELGYTDVEEVNQSLEQHVVAASAWAGGLAIGRHLIGCLLESIE